MTNPDFTRTPTVLRTRKRAPRVLLGIGISAALCAGALTGCGEESYDSDACAALPQYDIRPSKAQLRKAKSDQSPLPAVVAEGDGVVAVSPLGLAAQKQLQAAATAGCQTLPRFTPSLDETLEDEQNMNEQVKPMPTASAAIPDAGPN